jgi:hypothetical protein
MNAAPAAAAIPAAPPTVEAAVATGPAIAPPMATLWTAANTLPAATLPIPAWITAAVEPNCSEGLNVASRRW